MPPLQPLLGPQTEFLSRTEDIVFYGGAAGGGKTYGLYLELLRLLSVPNATGILFRRRSVDLFRPGGAYETFKSLVPFVKSTKDPMPAFYLPSTSVVYMGHLNQEGSIYNWQGSSIDVLCFDELTHFTLAQFLYMLSRNRGQGHTRPYVRATTNPLARSWVLTFIEPYLDSNGYPDLTKVGKTNYFGMLEGHIIIGNTPELVIQKTGIPHVKSYTFIAANLSDNPILEKNNPEYRTNLMSLPPHEREQLLKGNWYAEPTSDFFNKTNIQFYTDIPATDGNRIILSTDFAVTEKESADETVLSIFLVTPVQTLYLLDVWHGKKTVDFWVQELVSLVKQWDVQLILTEGGVIYESVRPLLDLCMRQQQVYTPVKVIASTAGKQIRIQAFKSLFERRKVYFPSNIPELIQDLLAFPKGKHDDFADTCALMGLFAVKYTVALDDATFPIFGADKAHNHSITFGAKPFKWG